MIVYGDALFLLNLLLDYCLLLVTAKIAACPFSRPRLALGALFGAAYALGVFLPGWGWLAVWPVRLCAGVTMLLIAFGGQRRFWRLTVICLGVTAMLGGGVLALMELGTATFFRGFPTTAADLLALLAAGFGVSAVVGFCFHRRGRSSETQRSVEVTVRLDGRSVTFRALVDTGNTLADRSNRPVLVADWQVLAELIPGLTRRECETPPLSFQRLSQRLGPGRVQMISFRSVGAASGLLLAVRPDEVTADGRLCPALLLAGTPHPVSDGGNYQGLIGPEGMGE